MCKTNLYLLSCNVVLLRMMGTFFCTLQIRSALRAIDSLKTISGSETCQPFMKLLTQIRYDEDLAEKFRAIQKENKM